MLWEDDMIAILTETGYMGGDIEFLRQLRYLEGIADGIAEGILAYLFFLELLGELKDCEE